MCQMRTLSDRAPIPRAAVRGRFRFRHLMNDLCIVMLEVRTLTIRYSISFVSTSASETGLDRTGRGE